MNIYQKLLIAYLVAINIITFFAFSIDKHKSKRHKRRIPEKTLLMFSAFGGAFLGILSMSLFKHKTNKKAFVVLLPIFTVIWIAIAYLLFSLTV